MPTFIYICRTNTSTVRFFIIGFKSSGKTTFGSKLATRLNMDFIDMDEYIERKYNSSVPELFTKEGEESFRRKEWKVLTEMVKKDNIVVSTGGGAACHCDNMSLMEKYGDTVYIKVDDETLVNRLKKLTADRPVVKGKSMTELRAYITGMKEKCEHHYLRAKYILENENIAVEKLVEMIADY
jgi:shikimate kinase